MPWFYVDDGFSDSKPVVNMPGRYRLAACGLWVLAGSWSAKEETDGYVPESKLRDLGATPELIRTLATGVAPLWQRDGNAAAIERRRVGNATFLNWSKWQKTHDELVARRRSDAKRQQTRRRKGRDAVSSADPEMSRCDTSVTGEWRHGVTHSVTAGDRHAGVTADAHARARGPDPTRPLMVDLRGEGYVSSGATSEKPPPKNLDNDEPPPFCDAHMPDGTTGPCRGCAIHRTARTDWLAQRSAIASEAAYTKARTQRSTATNARLQAIDACSLCDEDGYRPNFTVCDHEDRSATAANGSAAARQALAETRAQKANQPP